MIPLPSLSKSYKDPHTYPHGVAYQDGQYLLMKDAKVSVLDYGFLHSDATYDTVQVWDGAFFRLDLHLDRFFTGLAKLRMTIPYSRMQVTEILSNCVALSGHRAAYVEMICTRGGSPTFSRDPRDALNRFMAFAVPFGSVANPEQMARGLHLAISNVVRIPPMSLDPAIKNYHWLDLIQGLFSAYDQGAETAVLRDTNGNIAEGPGFNVFAAKNGQLTTPAVNILPGITRQTVFDICNSLTIPISAQDMPPATLIAADEVFITSTAGGIMAVSSVNGTPIGNGTPGQLTTSISNHYWHMHRSPEWSTAISYA